MLSSALWHNMLFLILPSSFLLSLSHELILAVIADQFSSLLAPLRSHTSVSDHAAGLATDGLHVLCVVDGPSRIVYHRGLHACLLTVLAVIPMLFLFSSNIRLQCVREGCTQARVTASCSGYDILGERICSGNCSIKCVFRFEGKDLTSPLHLSTMKIFRRPEHACMRGYSPKSFWIRKLFA